MWSAIVSNTTNLFNKLAGMENMSKTEIVNAGFDPLTFWFFIIGIPLLFAASIFIAKAHQEKLNSDNHP